MTSIGILIGNPCIIKAVNKISAKILVFITNTRYKNYTLIGTHLKMKASTLVYTHQTLVWFGYCILYVKCSPSFPSSPI